MSSKSEADVDKDTKRDKHNFELFNSLFGGGKFEEFIGDRLG